MSYVDQSSRPSPASMAAVIGVHAAIAAALVTGLTISGTIPEVITDFEARNIPDAIPPAPPPPPPAEPSSDPVAQQPAQPQIFTPTPKFDLKPAPNTVDTTDRIPLPIPTSRPGPRATLDIPRPTPSATFEPVGAKPRNDPARWLSDRDYKPSWARRELTGLARYRLDIATDGSVAGCTVTGSTGHSELDAATCQLVSKRARFEPARGGSGEPVGGSYDGAVRWALPE